MRKDMDGTVPRIGLTGGIGSGKTTVGQLLVAHGAGLLDADAFSRDSTAAGGSAIAAIRDNFGDAAIASSGALDRRWMRDLVFRDASARERLQAIIHPIVGQDMAERADGLIAEGKRWLAYDIPLLVESQRWLSVLDLVLVVDCSVPTQVARVQARDQLDRDTVERIIASQASRERRLACADAIICNDSLDRAQLDVDVADFVRSLRLSSC